MHFLDLPEVILFTIISYLKIGERIVLCQLSERFRLCITSYTRICDFDYQYAISHHEAIKYIKRNAKNVLKVNISSCFWFNKISTYNSICLCTNLQEFSALYLNISSNNLSNILSKTPNLHSLSVQFDKPLKNNDFTPKVIEVVKNLKHFTMFVAGEQNIFTFYNIFDSFTKLLTLSFKVLNKSNSTEFNFPKNCHELYKLTIDCPYINKHHLSSSNNNEYFLDGQKIIYLSLTNQLSSIQLRCFTNLVTLEMCDKQIHLAKLSVDLINLQNLSLYNCFIYTSQKVAFPFPKLITLHITQTKYDNTPDLTVVCDGLDCPKLKEFVIVNYKVVFKNLPDLQNILNNIKGLHCLKLPILQINDYQPYLNYKTLKLPRVSHLTEVSVDKEHILETILKNNLHLETLTLPPLTRGMNLKALNNLFYLTHLTFDSNETIERVFFYSMSQSSPYLSHLTITNISVRLTVCLLKDLLPFFKSLIYFNLSSDDLILPYKISLVDCKKLIFFIFCFKYQCNYGDVQTTPVEWIREHPVLSFVVALSPVIKKIREICVKSKPAAKFIEIPSCKMNLYQNIIDGKV